MDSLKQISNYLTPKKLKLDLIPTLWEPEWWRAKEGYCPYCGHKLYQMKTKPLYFCRSKKHKKRFVISADKVVDKKVVGNYNKVIVKLL